MSDRLLILYWNDLSFPSEVEAAELRDTPLWKDRALLSFRGLHAALRARPDCRISFDKGAFGHHVADRPLQSWLESWLGRDAFRRLRTAAIQPITIGEPHGHELDCELTCAGRCGDGLTRAHLAESWTWSIGADATVSNGPLIPAEKISIDSAESSAVQVANIADGDHVTHWLEQLEAWGKVPSANHVIARVGDWQVIMYPLDHGYPHIHVKALNDGVEGGKYRVDVFEPLTTNRPAGLDEVISGWVEQHRETLMTSWRRCKRGLHPLKLG